MSSFNFQVTETLLKTKGRGPVPRPEESGEEVREICTSSANHVPGNGVLKAG